MGACVFLGKPPFRVLKISKRPLFHGNFYSSPKNPNVKAYVVYPSGVFIQNDKIYVSYGENDSSIKMIIINKNHFFQEMFE
jgi:predicted GH43/DUF377 family glycosyl hydrolase